MISFPSLPNELLLLIAGYLCVEADLNALTRSSRQFHGLLNKSLYRRRLQQPHGRSALLWAAEHDRENTLRKFLEVGANPEVTHEATNETPFILAAFHGHVSIVELLLLDDRVDFNATDWNGRTALSRAAMKGCSAVVKLLSTVDRIDLNHGDIHRKTPLYLAVERAHEEVAKLLLATNRLDLKQERGLPSPVIEAAQRGHREIVRLLVQHGADPGYINEVGATPLHYAAVYGHEDLVEMLLSLNVDPDQACANGCTPLGRATEWGRVGVVKQLLAREEVNPDAVVNVVNHDRCTPLSIAAWLGNTEIVECLLRRGGVDVNSKNAEGRTPLWRAAARGHRAVVRLLLAQEGIQSDLPDFMGRTPLLVAIKGHQWYMPTQGDYLDVAEQLLEHDLDWNATDSKGDTPLLAAASKGRESMVKALVARGARIDCRDHYGRTPFMWAKWWNNSEMEETLLRHAVECGYTLPWSVRERAMTATRV